MSTRFNAGTLLDFSAPAFAVITGNASGVAPKLSGWIKVDHVDTIAFHLTTASATNGVWSAQLAEGPAGQGAVALPNPPAFPTGTNQDAVVVIAIPSTQYKYLQLTFVPSAGSGAVSATPGAIIGRAVYVQRNRNVGVVFDCLAAATLAGQGALDFSANANDGTTGGLGDLDVNTPQDPAVWFPAVDETDTPIAIAALVASTGQVIPIRLGQLEFEAMRAKFTPSAGFGRYRAMYNAKA